MLQESVDTTDVECPGSSSESENGSTPACEVDIIDEMLLGYLLIRYSGGQASQTLLYV